MWFQRPRIQVPKSEDPPTTTTRTADLPPPTSSTSAAPPHQSILLQALDNTYGSPPSAPSTSEAADLRTAKDENTSASASASTTNPVIEDRKVDKSYSSVTAAAAEDDDSPQPPEKSVFLDTDYYEELLYIPETYLLRKISKHMAHDTDSFKLRIQYACFVMDTESAIMPFLYYFLRKNHDTHQLEWPTSVFEESHVQQSVSSIHDVDTLFSNHLIEFLQHQISRGGNGSGSTRFVPPPDFQTRILRGILPQGTDSMLVFLDVTSLLAEWKDALFVQDHDWTAVFLDEIVYSGSSQGYSIPASVQSLFFQDNMTLAFLKKRVFQVEAARSTVSLAQSQSQQRASSWTDSMSASLLGMSPSPSSSPAPETSSSNPQPQFFEKIEMPYVVFPCTAPSSSASASTLSLEDLRIATNNDDQPTHRPLAAPMAIRELAALGLDSEMYVFSSFPLRDEDSVEAKGRYPRYLFFPTDHCIDQRNPLSAATATGQLGNSQTSSSTSSPLSDNQLTDFVAMFLYNADRSKQFWVTDQTELFHPILDIWSSSPQISSPSASNSHPASPPTSTTKTTSSSSSPSPSPSPSPSLSWFRSNESRKESSSDSLYGFF